MRPLTEPQLRAAFVNCSRGEAKRLPVPHDLAVRPWADLDLLGWRDPKAPARAYLAAEVDGEVRAVALRTASPSAARPRRALCQVCLTTPAAGVSLMVAARAGQAGRQGDTVGTYLCDDLACSLYTRGLKDPGPGARLPETLELDERVARTVENLSAFVRQVMA